MGEAAQQTRKRTWRQWSPDELKLFKDLMLRFHSDFQSYLPYFKDRTYSQIKGCYHNTLVKRKQRRKESARHKISLPETPQLQEDPLPLSNNETPIDQHSCSSLFD